MLQNHIINTLTKLAKELCTQLIPLPQTTALIMKHGYKIDRIDLKLIKQAQKRNQKEQLGEIKIEHRKGIREGAITYRSYTIQFKKELIASIRQAVTQDKEGLSKIIRDKAKQHSIHPKNITRWYHAKELKKKQGGRRALYPEMEMRLATFITQNPTLKRKHILTQARKIMEELNIPGREEFNFSKGWYERFRERLNKRKVRGVDAKLEKWEEGKYQAKQEVKLEWSDSQEDYEDQVYDDSTVEEIVKLEEEMIVDLDDQKHQEKQKRSLIEEKSQRIESQRIEASIFFQQQKIQAGSQSFFDVQEILANERKRLQEPKQ